MKIIKLKTFDDGTILYGREDMPEFLGVIGTEEDLEGTIRHKLEQAEAFANICSMG